MQSADCHLRDRYFTPKEGGAFTALWFHVVPLDEHTTRVFNHAVIVQPMHPALKVRPLTHGNFDLGPVTHFALPHSA